MDVVVTSSAVEHDICFWETFLELARILRPGGLLYVNAPSNGPFHRCPLDCWRFYPDAGVALARWAARRAMTLEVVESFVAQPKAHGWADFIAVFHKAGGPALARRGRIADSAEAINVFDVGMQAGAALERETSFMPGIAAIKNGMSKLQAREAEMKDPSQVAAQIAALEKALAEVAAQQVVAVQNLEAIRASTSWRLTAVLRWLAVAVRGR